MRLRGAVWLNEISGHSFLLKSLNSSEKAANCAVIWHREDQYLYTRASSSSSRTCPASCLCCSLSKAFAATDLLSDLISILSPVLYFPSHVGNIRLHRLCHPCSSFQRCNESLRGCASCQRYLAKMLVFLTPRCRWA
jgi:hypothetical protein